MSLILKFYSFFGVLLVAFTQENLWSLENGFRNGLILPNPGKGLGPSPVCSREIDPGAFGFFSSWKYRSENKTEGFVVYGGQHGSVTHHSLLFFNISTNEWCRWWGDGEVYSTKLVDGKFLYPPTVRASREFSDENYPGSTGRLSNFLLDDGKVFGLMSGSDIWLYSVEKMQWAFVFGNVTTPVPGEPFYDVAREFGPDNSMGLWRNGASSFVGGRKYVGFFSGHMGAHDNGRNNMVWLIDVGTWEMAYLEGTDRDVLLRHLPTFPSGRGVYQADAKPGARHGGMMWPDIHDGRFYIFGGMGQGTMVYPQNELWSYNTTRALDNHGDTGWLWWGGNSGRGINSIEIEWPDLSSGSVDMPWPAGRNYCNVDIDNSGTNVFLIGGDVFDSERNWFERTGVNQIWRLDLVERVWHFEKPTTGPADGMGVYVSKGSWDDLSRAKLPVLQHGGAYYVDELNSVYFVGGSDGHQAQNVVFQCELGSTSTSSMYWSGKSRWLHGGRRNF